MPKKELLKMSKKRIFIKTIPLIQARGHEEAFGLSFAKEDFKKVVESLQAL
ncbi:hypothetical protein HG566_04695 [Helicobacter pylori]|uniref:hypothetical protein n=1 Tax=Helicobacter pylori TaxID=210 RepID=UPI0019210496|nr:hypothetical protein [Helicobacter pylori]QQW84427.1 hypothetical protein HG568_04795 [Helicobacter pylori]QQW87298.1 hypothetical protein HG566_04695 [Helicobacter pylori]WRB00599.1 hypothetical protein E5L34_04970 [Helicobacter pylori]